MSHQVRLLSLSLLVFVVLTPISCGFWGGAEAARRRQFQSVDRQLRQVVEAAERNDLARAVALFDQGPHGFLPTLDLPLRNRGEEDLGNEIHRLTNEIESELFGSRRSPVVARLGRDILALLPRVAEALGTPYTP